MQHHSEVVHALPRGAGPGSEHGPVEHAVPSISIRIEVLRVMHPRYMWLVNYLHLT